MGRKPAAALALASWLAAAIAAECALQVQIGWPAYRFDQRIEEEWRIRGAPPEPSVQPATHDDPGIEPWEMVGV